MGFEPGAVLLNDERFQCVCLAGFALGLRVRAQFHRRENFAGFVAGLGRGQLAGGADGDAFAPRVLTDINPLAGRLNAQQETCEPAIADFVGAFLGLSGGNQAVTDENFIWAFRGSHGRKCKVSAR